MQDSDNNPNPNPNPNPVQPLPVVDPVAPQNPLSPTPPNPTPVPTPTEPQSYNSANSNNSFGNVAILASLIPPIGLILGLISIVKGSKTKNKKLSLFGGVAIILSILISLLYAFVVIPRIPALAGSKYSKTKDISISSGSLNLSIPIPEAFEEDTSKSSPAASRKSGIQASTKAYFIYADPKEKKDILAGLVFTMVDLSKLKSVLEKSGEETGTVDEFITEVIETDDSKILQTIEKDSSLNGFSNAKIVSKSKSGNNGYIIKFTAETKTSKNETIEMVGSFYGVTTDDFEMVNVSQFVTKDVYNKNKKVFDNIEKSIVSQVK